MISTNATLTKNANGNAHKIAGGAFVSKYTNAYNSGTRYDYTDIHVNEANTRHGERQLKTQLH